jgi:ligand-binding sensor domain-containing protein
MFHDRESRLWVGTRNGKHVAWIDSKGVHPLSLLNGRDSVTVNDIFEDRSGNIWFAVTPGGLIKYNGVVPRVIHPAEWFAGDQVNAIGEDKQGNLWFGLASRGAVKYTLPVN